jgi:hypothetical protein
MPFLAGAVAAFAMASALGGVFGVEAEMEESIEVRVGLDEDVAAASAVAAAGAAAWNVLLAPERKTAVAAVAGFHADANFIDEHERI